MARSFGLHFPRNSKEQALQMPLVIPVEALSPAEKLARLREAAKMGIVLLHFPGHIMAYLGLGEDGRDRVLHAFSEYLEPCGQDSAQGETLVSVDRVTVSDLGLGAETSRASFLERLSSMAVLLDNDALSQP